MFKILFGTGRDKRREKCKSNCVKKFFTLLTLHATRYGNQVMKERTWLYERSYKLKLIKVKVQ